MSTITLPRTGDSPLRFDGEIIAEAGGKQFAGREQNRYHCLALYRVAGHDRQYVLSIAYHTDWQGESHRDTVHVCDSPEDVRRVLREYEPVREGVGFPPGDQYADRQRRLESQIREQYDACVSEILGGDEFAQTIEGAREDEYVGLDHEAIAEFVRHVLADFPLTRGEACALCDANNGAILLGAFWWSGLWANIEDTPARALSEKWECDAASLAARIRDADRATQFALAWAVAQFWRHCEQDTDTLLPACGFAISSPPVG
jgi:hypothetical protein